jgi:hypothetical protein
MDREMIRCRPKTHKLPYFLRRFALAICRTATLFINHWNMPPQRGRYTSFT